VAPLCDRFVSASHRGSLFRSRQLAGESEVTTLRSEECDSELEKGQEMGREFVSRDLVHFSDDLGENAGSGIDEWFSNLSLSSDLRDSAYAEKPTDGKSHPYVVDKIIV
jgi:hypothetical protein